MYLLCNSHKEFIGNTWTVWMGGAWLFEKLNGNPSNDGSRSWSPKVF